MYKHLLIPIDESALSMRVIERGVELARAFGARASFLYLQPDAQDIIDGDAGLLHAMAPALFARKYLWADGYVEAKARAWAQMNGVKADFIGGVSRGKVHEEIMATAAARAADLVVIGSHGRTTILQKLLDSVTVKLILNSPLPVFVAETGVAPETVKDRLIARFREEHAAWVALTERLVDALTVDESHIDTALVDDALDFLARFSREAHGPKEARLLAALEAVGGAAAGLATIEAQLEEELQCFAELQAAWCRRGEAGIAPARAAVMAWRDFIVSHVRDENRLLLLRADDMLSEAGWARLGQEVDGPGRQVQRDAYNDEFRRLFARFKAGKS
ncbi:universal stress protein [Metapseudomonas furukawaii]|uniref:universal stress protein n=1 Tax=Metapseudomonas furukawaii TaxID=1149133 RepID=UPI00227BB39F|nr:universal stress protein [Pseudomonas furukawaii]WAG81567.1 universal stress protein [Pseudomonas furukawaii]